VAASARSTHRVETEAPLEFPECPSAYSDSPVWCSDTEWIVVYLRPLPVCTEIPPGGDLAKSSNVQFNAFPTAVKGQTVPLNLLI